MSSLDSFSVSFKETFPAFPDRTYSIEETSIFDQIDTRTIAILGSGRRRELLVRSATGEQTEGEPQNFNPTLEPAARYFKASTFPIDPRTFRVFRGVGGTVELTASEYLLDDVNGYLVLYHPLAKGEQLSIDYISYSDVNLARGFLESELADLYEIYGDPSVTNTISAAAQIAFANGAPRLIVVQGDHTGVDPYWFGAYEALERQRPYIVVPMQNGHYGNLIAAGLTHVQTMSDVGARRERFLLVGELTDTEVATDYLPRSVVADFYNEDRIAFIASDNPVSVIAGETAQAQGGFLAAAVAGAWASFEYIPQPLTNKDLARINVIWPRPDIYSERELRQIVNDGVTLISQRNTVGFVYQFTTTIHNGNPVDLEPSIWRIRDYTAMSIRTLLENRYVGRPLVLERILPAIQDTTVRHLQSLIDQRILVKFSNVRVDVDSIEPRQVNISFDAQPVFPLNILSIPFRVVSTL